MKYVDTLVSFSEIPDEITLCINISGCKIRCKDCHSKWLWDDKGTELTKESLDSLIEDGVTCVCFMGGDNVSELARHVHSKGLKTAWYTGRDKVNVDLGDFDYIKLHPYIKEFGGLRSPLTNQRVYKIEDITNRYTK